ncbi:glycoside hydrolase family 99-like domain-containing protein, partial [Arenimonas sp.]|uniref:glycosyltransferase WbsX family protein n=1 Tax=Arenimonas sp. TaxID=1872635 RepID=UPI0025C121DE
LAQPSIDFPFCLCWANENWTRRWDGRDDEVLISQEHGPENDLAFIRDLERYLRDPRYLRIDGRPLVVVYRASLLPDAAATVERWREHCRQAGIGEIFVAMVQFDAEDPRPFGFDAAMEFPPHKLANGFERINDTLDIINPGYRGSVFHYQSIVDSAKAWPERGFPLVRGVFPGWDNEARRPGKGYTFAFSTPERYRAWLAASVAYAEQHPVAGERLVMINAWNEWAEGAKLEPDSRHGHAYLHATRQALEAADPTGDGSGS